MKLISVALSFTNYFLALMPRPGLKLGDRLNSASAFHILLNSSTRGYRESERGRAVTERFTK